MKEATGYTATARELNAIAMGINWREADSKFGITSKERYEIQEKKKRHDYPEPPFERKWEERKAALKEWAKGLNTHQATTAYYDYYEKWTWDTGSDLDGEVYEVLDKELNMRGDPPNEGDAYFDTTENCAYIFCDGKWVLMAGSAGIDI